MNAKHGEERRRLILAQARGSGHIAVTDIADELDVAAETVRRDLKVLEDHGLLRRTHGGAYPVEGAGFESNMAHRSESWVPESAGSPSPPPTSSGPRRPSTSTRDSPRNWSPRNWSGPTGR